VCVFLAPGAARSPEGKRSLQCGPDLCERARWASAESINQAQLKRATMALLLLLLAGRASERGPRTTRNADARMNRKSFLISVRALVKKKQPCTLGQRK